jgi:hypothetical protein
LNQITAPLISVTVRSEMFVVYWVCGIERRKRRNAIKA